MFAAGILFLLDVAEKKKKKDTATQVYFPEARTPNGERVDIDSREIKEEF